MNGSLFRYCTAKLRERLIILKGDIESAIDFAEEEIEFVSRDAAISQVELIRDGIDDIRRRCRNGSRLSGGIDLPIVGKPNSGKSSLLNRLLGQDRAIVSDIAGTTRDTLAETLSIEGIPVTLIDTAGLRETDHPIEQLGIERSWTEIEQADLLVWIIDASIGIQTEDKTIITRCPNEIKKLIVYNKIDLTQQMPSTENAVEGTLVYCSAKQDMGIDLLKQVLLQQIGWVADTETPFVARERHLFALSQAKAAFERAFNQFDRLEFAAEELRLAHQALGEIVGTFSTEDLLGEIFSRFCIGK